MAKTFEGRLLRLEQFHRNGLAEGCQQCRGWGHAVYEFDGGVEDPPPFCSVCGRSRPETYVRRIYGLPIDFDTVEVPHASAT